MTQASPHNWVPRRNPLWYPGNPLRAADGSPLPYTLDDVAGRPLDPQEYASLLTEIRDCTKFGKGAKLGKGVKAGKLGVAFTPLDISGTVAWFDMLDSGSWTNSGGFITSITNKFSSVAWTEATNPPAYLSTGFNSLPTMDYNGTSQHIISTEAAVAATHASGATYTLMAAHRFDVLNLAAQPVFGCGVATGTNLRNIRYYGAVAAGTKWRAAGAVNNTGTGSFPDSTGVADTNYNVGEVFHTGSDVSLVINGSAADPNAFPQTTSPVTPTRSAMGVLPTVTLANWFDGKLSELYLNSNNLSSGNRSALRVYMGARWAVTVAP